LVGLLRNELPNGDGVGMLPVSHILVECKEVVVAGQPLDRIVLGRQSILDVPTRYFADLEFHDLLQVYIAEIVHYPLYFDVVNIDAGSHAQVVD